MGSIMNPTY